MVDILSKFKNGQPKKDRYGLIDETGVVEDKSGIALENMPQSRRMASRERIEDSLAQAKPEVGIGGGRRPKKKKTKPGSIYRG